MYLQIYPASPFSSAIQQTVIKLEDSTIKSVRIHETFLYEPFGSGFDAVTKIITTMNLNLKKMSSVHSRKLDNFHVLKPIAHCKSKTMLDTDSIFV